MARIIQYKDNLFINNSGESIQNEDGEWVEAEQSKDFLSKCRAESDGRGTEYNVGGGKFIKSTVIIYCPTSCPEINKGASVVILDDEGNLIQEGIVLNYFKSQLHTRIWL